MSKSMRFKSRAKADAAVAECQDNGWRAFIVGRKPPYFVDAIGRGDRCSIRYNLGDDGFMHEYSRSHDTD